MASRVSMVAEGPASGGFGEFTVAELWGRGWGNFNSGLGDRVGPVFGPAPLRILVFTVS